MRTKLLFTLLSFATYFNSFAQIEATDYISGLIEPSAMVHQGNILYVQGTKNLYKIDTSLPIPTATVIYTAPVNFYMTNLTINNNLIYISEENYIEATDTYIGCRIISIDVNNLSNQAVIFLTTEYVSSLAILASDLYFTSETAPDGDDNFTVQVKKIDLTVTNPPATIIVSNLTTNEAANDMTFYSNNLLVSVGGQSKVFGFDVTDAVITVTDYLTGLNFNKGMFVNNNTLFIAEANLIKKTQLNVSSSLTSVAQNTTYQDTFNNIPFNANFRDVVLIGDKLYMTLLSQGKVVFIQDATLSTPAFNSDLNGVSIYNSKTLLTINGLETDKAATIYTISGQQISNKTVSPDANTIDIQSLSTGVYVLKLADGQTFKFVK